MKCWMLIWESYFLFSERWNVMSRRGGRDKGIFGSCEMCVLGFGEFVLNGVEFLSFMRMSVSSSTICCLYLEYRIPFVSFSIRILRILVLRSEMSLLMMRAWWMGSSAKRTNFWGCFVSSFRYEVACCRGICNKKFYIVQIIFIILELIKKYKFFISHADCVTVMCGKSVFVMYAMSRVSVNVLSLFVFYRSKISYRGRMRWRSEQP